MTPMKFTSRAITQGGNKARVYYLLDNQTSNITIYAREYRGFSNIDLSGHENLNYFDDSDSMTDYFSKPHLAIHPDNKLYAAVLAAHTRQEEISTTKYNKRAKKRADLKLEFTRLLEQNPGEYMLVQGSRFKVLTAAPHTRHEGFMAYTMKRWNSKSTKTYYFSQSADKKRYIPLMTI